MHEAAFLAHQAIHPGFVEVELLRVILHQLAVGRRVAQAEIVQDHRALGGIDRAFVPVVAHRQHGRGEQLLVVVVLDRPLPFERAFVAQAGPVQRQRTPDAAVGGDGVHFVAGRMISLRRRTNRCAEILGGKLAVEVEFIG